MVDLEDIKQVATIETDLLGRPVVRIPRDLWETWITQGVRPQNEWMFTLLDEGNDRREDNLDDWWDEF